MVVKTILKLVISEWYIIPKIGKKKSKPLVISSKREIHTQDLSDTLEKNGAI